MTQFVFANNVNTTLASAISSSATTLTLASSANLPASIPAGEYFALTLNDAATRLNYEIVYATAVSGATLTVVRAQEGTTAQAWAVGDFTFSGPTAGQMASFNTGGSGVTSFNTRTGTVTLSASDVNTALGYTAANQAAVVLSFNGRQENVVMNGADVDTALGYTPANDSLVVHLAGTETISGAKTFGTTITGTSATFSGTVTAATSNTTSSDRRLKRNIRKIEPRPLHRAIPYVSFVRKRDGSLGRGTIAQDVFDCEPCYITSFKLDGHDRLAVDYQSLAFEQATWASREVDKHAKVIAKLEARIAKLERRK